MASNANRFTAMEDELILSPNSPKQIALLLNRSYSVIRVRRHILKTKMHLSETRDKPWTAAEVKRLKEHYPKCDSMKELLRRFPGRTALQIRGKASNLKLKKIVSPARRDDCTGVMEVIDQIRIRCKQDGISYVGLDREIGESYFHQFRNRKRRVNYRAVLKAIEFFDAKLIIDWQDR